MTILDDFLNANGFALLDGATGTELFKMGLESGAPPEAWNLDEPDKIRRAYRAYVDAGSDMFLTNSFGGTHYRLALHKLDDQVEELNEAAARLGREVADEAMATTPGRTVLVAGSMGPTGELLEPMGSMTSVGCTAAFAQQATGLAAGGADVLWIETMSSVEEVEAAVAGAREVCDLPICVTMSFDTAGRTMMGVTGTTAGELAVRLGVDAIGANCGNNLVDNENAIREMLAAAPGIPVISKSNSGIPEWRGTDLIYNATPDVMAACAHQLRELGVKIIGGCCGTTTEHVALMRAVLDGDAPVPEVEQQPATIRIVAKQDAEDGEGGARGGRRRRRRRG